MSSSSSIIYDTPITRGSSQNMDWVIGVILSLTATVLSCLGLVIQKLVVNRLNHEGSDKPFWKVPLWWVGMGSVISATLCDLFSFNFANLSLLAPLGTMTMLNNMILGPVILKTEVLTRYDVMCTCVILSGIILSVVFGSKSSEDYTSSELIKLYNQPAVYVYFVFFACLGAFTGTLYSRHAATEKVAKLDLQTKCLTEKRSSTCVPAELEMTELHHDNASSDDAICISTQPSRSDTTKLSMTSDKSTKNSLMDVDRRSSMQMDEHSVSQILTQEETKEHKMLRFLLPSLSGTFGSLSGLMGKSLAEMASTSFSKTLNTPVTYIFIPVMLTSLIMQIRVLNAGFSVGDILLIIPVYQVMWSMMNITVGMVYFRDYESMTTANLIAFPIAVILIFVGIYFLSRRKSSTDLQKVPSSAPDFNTKNDDTVANNIDNVTKNDNEVTSMEEIELVILHSHEK